MESRVSREEIIALINERNDDELEELLRILKSTSYAIRTPKREASLGDRISDSIASFAGSWPFIVTFLVVLVVWIVYNASADTPLDPFPFILLNLLLSMIAAIQAPLILMSQNREEEKNKEQLMTEFFINVKSELLLEDLHGRMQKIEKRLEQCVPPSK